MAYEERELSGSLFINDKREEGSNQPNMRGTLTINGVQYRLSGWTKHSDRAGKWLSLAASPPEDQSPADNNYGEQSQETPF